MGYRTTSGSHSHGAFSPDTYSTAPMSQAMPCGRETLRWSGDGQAEPPSTALPGGKGICVSVEPPLFASGPRFAAALFQSAVAGPLLVNQVAHEASLLAPGTARYVSLRCALRNSTVRFQANCAASVW
jgi:hypothetical protein